MQDKQLESIHHYKCCFCRYFQLEGHSWGHCEILNVEVKGNCPACSIAEPFFALPQEHEENKKPEQCIDAKIKTRQIEAKPRASHKNTRHSFTADADQDDLLRK